MKESDISDISDRKEEQPDWLRCPKCGGKTRTRILVHTVLENFPMFCPKCRYTCVINFRNGKIEEIRMPDAQTQCRPE